MMGAVARQSRHPYPAVHPLRSVHYYTFMQTLESSTCLGLAALLLAACASEPPSTPPQAGVLKGCAVDQPEYPPCEPVPPSELAPSPYYPNTGVVIYPSPGNVVVLPAPVLVEPTPLPATPAPSASAPAPKTPAKPHRPAAPPKPPCRIIKQANAQPLKVCP